MAMTIKSDRVVAKIRTLARSLGKGQLETVEIAVDQLRESAGIDASALERRTAEVLGISGLMRQIIDDPALTSTATDGLYDEAGLPN